MKIQTIVEFDKLASVLKIPILKAFSALFVTLDLTFGKSINTSFYEAC
jgi:hypothetical protein